MPIKKENKNLYPKNWKEIREHIRLRADDKCEWCGVVNYSWINSKTRKIQLQDEENSIQVICTTAHLDHNPENCQDENLSFLCQRCHNRYDAPHRLKTRRNAKLKLQLSLNI